MACVFTVRTYTCVILYIVHASTFKAFDCELDGCHCKAWLVMYGMHIDNMMTD